MKFNLKDARGLANAALSSIQNPKLNCPIQLLERLRQQLRSGQAQYKCPMTNHYRYIIFYKPYGVLSQFTKDAPTHSTLKDYIDVPDVYPVGRLDWDSEGLLLLTNDGQLQHRLAHPRFGHKRTYWVQVERIPDADAIKRLQTSVEIQDYRTQPAEVRLLPKEPELPERTPPIRFRKNVPTAWLEITLTEGKNRQVRRMTAAVGFPTLRLVRVSIAHLVLDDLQLGQWRDLTISELQFLDNFSKSKTFPPKANAF